MLIDLVRANTPTGPQNIVIKRATTPADIAKLEREADILVSYAHDGIVTRVNTAVPVAGNGLYMMRVEGPSLAEYNRLRGPLLPVQVAGEMAVLCRTLAAMHRRGVTHGAIDASHVLLRADGQPILCSWGRTGATPADDCRGLAQLVLDQLQPATTTPTVAPESDDDVRARLVLLEITDEILRRNNDAMPALADLGALIENHVPNRQLAAVTGQAATQLKESRTPPVNHADDELFPQAPVPPTPPAESTLTPVAPTAPPQTQRPAAPFDAPGFGNQAPASNPFATPAPLVAAEPPANTFGTHQTAAPQSNDQSDDLFDGRSHAHSLGRSLAIGIGVMIPIVAIIFFFGFHRGGTRSPNASAIPGVTTTTAAPTTTEATTTTTFAPAASTSLPGVVAGTCTPANDQLEIDYDGDGCPEATNIAVTDGPNGGQIKILSVFKVDALGNRTELARVSGTSPDDQFTAGDWSGKGLRTPALWLARSRCVYVYDSWDKTKPARAIFQSNDQLQAIGNAPIGNGSTDQIIITNNDNVRVPLAVPAAPASPASDICP